MNAYDIADGSKVRIMTAEGLAIVTGKRDFPDRGLITFEGRLRTERGGYRKYGFISRVWTNLDVQNG